MSRNQTRALLAISICFAGSAAMRSAEVAAEMGVGARLEPAITAVEAAFSPTPLIPQPQRPVPSEPQGAAMAQPIVWTASRAIEPAVEETRSAKEPAPATTIPDGDLNAFVKALKTRSQELDAFQAKLDERANRLEEAERRIDDKLTQIASVRAQLEDLVKQVEGAQQQDIAHLAAMYSRMKPKKAGAIFDTMDVRFAAEFLSRMKPDVAALIMANMDAARAYETSLVLAGRNKEAARAAGGLKR